MSWQPRFTGTALRDLERLSKSTQAQVLKKVGWMCRNFEEITPLPLGGRWHGFFKLRMGDWRVVYEISWRENVLYVHAVGNRRDVYSRSTPRTIVQDRK